jgi:hypothetical protein
VSKPKRGMLFTPPANPDPAPDDVLTLQPDQPLVTEPPSDESSVDESSVVQLPTPAPHPRAVAGARKPEKPRHNRATTRIGKRLVTAYVEPEALKQLKLISVDEEKTIQDLLIEGLNAVFQKRGLTRCA